MTSTDARVDNATCELSIVLPCLNEAETVALCVVKARASLERLGARGEVVVADNGSSDGSQQLAIGAGARVVDVPKRGYGAALRHGIAAARGRFVLMADADDSYALDDLGPFLEALRGGADLVMGNRFRGGIEPGAMPFLHRRLGNPVLSRLGRLFFRIPVGDFHCGMRAFRRDRIIELGLQTDGMEFASEMVVRASLNGLRIVEVPTVLRPDGRSRAPHLRTWHDGWRHLKFLLAFSPRWLFYYPALFLATLGAAGLVVLSFGPRQIGAVEFSVQTMLACATALIVGIQMLGLAVVSRSYATHLQLLPPSPRLERGLERITLERGLLIGVVFLAGGLAAFVVALARWESTGFGRLDPVSSVRVPIAGMVLVVAGVQLMMLSFTMSLTRIGNEGDAVAAQRREHSDHPVGQ
jgi:hypothetical protein